MAEIFSAIAVAVSALTLIVAIVIYNKNKTFSDARGHFGRHVQTRTETG